jgi:hypothetical protein
MSSILYYSNYCNNCKTLLQIIGKGTVKNDMHFINIDKRIKKTNGATYIVLENGQEILLPPTITKVPALLLLMQGHQVLFGADINKHLEPKQLVQAAAAVKNNGEPLAFSMMGYGSASFGVASDNYSFLDQDATALSAKGDGGMRQQHHYATLDYNVNIDTPPDTYAPDTIGSVSMEKLQQQRNSDINYKK